MTEQSIESKVLINMKVNDLFREFDETKHRFFLEEKNSVLSDAMQGEIWTTAAANSLLCALGMTIRTQDQRRSVLASIGDMLERMYPEQPDNDMGFDTSKNIICKGDTSNSN